MNTCPNFSVYQEKDYLEALSLFEKKLIKISDNFYAIEKTIKLPLFGQKKIIESRGIFSIKNLKKFREISKNYFYATIAPIVVKKTKNFEKLKFYKTTNHTILIDLKKTKEELWKNMEKKSIRWGVKTAEKNNLRFKPADLNELNNFYKIYKETALKGKFEPEKKGFLEKLRDTKISKLFLIKEKKQIVAGGLILIDKSNNYSILDLTASTEKGLKLQAMPFLYWNLILYSKNNNLNYFDLGGYDKEAKKGDKTYNINKFKERFGGNIVEQPIYSTNWKYYILRKLMSKLKFLKFLYKKS